MKHLTALTALTFGLIAFTACGAPPATSPNSGPSSGPVGTPVPGPAQTGPLAPIVKVDTRVVDAASRAALAEFRVTAAPANAPRTLELRFANATPFLAALQPGQVLVSEPSAAAPNGFLVRAVSVRAEGDGVVVVARDARITDAIEQGEVVMQQALAPERLRSVEDLAAGATLTTSAGRVRAQDLSSGKNYNFHLSLDQTFLKENGFEAGTKGHIDFNADAGVTLKITYDWIIPTGVFFRAGVGLDQSARFEAYGKANATIDKSIPLKKLHFDPIVTYIGPVPVVFTPVLTLSMDMSGKIEGELSYELVESVGAGAAVQFDGSFSKDFQAPALKFEQGLKKVMANADLKVGPKLKLDLLLYGLAGASGAAQIYGHAVAHYPVGSPQLDLDLCARIDLGVDATTIDDDLHWAATLFDKCADVVTWTNKAPVVEKLTAERVNLFGGPNFTVADDLKLCATAKDEEDGAVPVLFASTKEALPAPDAKGCVVYRFKTAGIRTVTATAKDSGGLTATKTIALDIREVDLPVPTATIQSPASGDTLFLNGGLASTLLKGASSLEDCTKEKWTSSNPSDALSPNNCGAPFATFNSVGTRTLTLTATNAQGETGQASVTVNVQPKPAGNQPASATIAKPVNGSYVGDATFPVEAVLSDADNDAVSYTLTVRRQLDGLTKTLAQGSVTNTLNGQVVAKSLRIDTLFGNCSVGAFTLTLSASDGKQAAPTVKTKTLTIQSVCPS